MARNAVDWLTRRWRHGLHGKPLAVIRGSAGCYSGVWSRRLEDTRGGLETRVIEPMTVPTLRRGQEAVAEWANAVLNNGLGNYQQAMRAGERAAAYSVEMIVPTWSVVELVEAAGRSGRSDIAADAYRRLAEITSASGTNWARGTEARSRALLSDGDTAERFYRESIECLGPTRIRVDLARASAVRRMAAPGASPHRAGPP